MYCNQCGTQLPEQADFCPVCGARAPGSARRVRTARGKNSIVIAAIAAVTVVLVVAILCFTWMVYSSQQGTSAAQDGAQSAAGGAAVQSDAQDEQKTEDDAEQNSGTQTPAAVTNNYYYYGEDAASGNDYYENVDSTDYLWPTDSQYISTADLRGMSEDTVAAIRNEIYARHGYAFTTARWQNYFAAKTWYHRDSTCTESTIRARLSSIERANISTIVAYEESRGWR